MLLHTHDVVQHEGEDPTPVYFLHLNKEEAQALINGLSGAIASNPDSPSYSVNLGAAASVDLPVEEPTQNGNGLITPGGGLIVP